MAPLSAPSLAQLINRAARAFARDADNMLRPLGLRYAQVPALALLNEGVELTQKELAEATGIEQPSMAQLLARMDRDGLIRRKPNPHDARSQTIQLAGGAEARLTEAHEHLVALDQRAVAGFTADEIATLRHLLTRLGDNLDRRNDPFPDPS
ncbi:MarR family winged helix-turn-helix transcriptional regulator [Nocardia africana]|uniref:Multiple antibiotic resistance protein marR n=1 Tax=Nocardia africana TaxID=134964 RepID=A0A378WWN2_9NOCA|nr:MarR family winged helix-turn-helix transcriptional regulator [Nocardia africana]MCC3313794.1 MarR family winged helix-turn-helix transcriptional regulator [Nocardia africana]SUA44824.1 Multiple antibiotic resistance protein marR [Nocardia africana]